MARSELVDDGLWELVKPLLPQITFHGDTQSHANIKATLDGQ